MTRESPGTTPAVTKLTDDAVNVVVLLDVPVLAERDEEAGVYRVDLYADLDPKVPGPETVVSTSVGSRRSS